MYNTAMASTVVAVHVHNGQGKRVSLEAEAYHTVVEDVVVRPERGSMGEIIFTTMSGRNRSRAIENQKYGKLQDNGDLFPTE